VNLPEDSQGGTDPARAVWDRMNRMDLTPRDDAYLIGALSVLAPDALNKALDNLTEHRLNRSAAALDELNALTRHRPRVTRPH
jgi:hypothetical protein